MSLDPSTSDNSGPLETHDPAPSPNSDDERIQENRTLAFSVYKEVWDEFNKWKVEDCKQQLRLLEQPLPPQNIAESTKRLASAFRTDSDGSEPGDVEIIYICDTEDEDDIPVNMSSATVLTYEDVFLKLPPDFKPHPPYESCTASVQTIALREANAVFEENGIAPFIPYADGLNWNVRMYLNQFESFAWERLADPDCKWFHLSFELAHAGSLIGAAMIVEVIQFEVLRRLHFGHGLSLEDIDVTGVLPESRQSNRYGLIYQMTQRCVGLLLMIFSPH